MVTFDLDKLNKVLDSLKGFPNVREVRELRKRIQKEQKKIIKSVVRVVTSPKVDANVIRSAKLKRYWRYVKLIRDNFPDLKTNQIRTQLKQRSQGLETKIPDAIWQNPSG